MINVSGGILATAFTPTPFTPALKTLIGAYSRLKECVD